MFLQEFPGNFLGTFLERKQLTKVGTKSSFNIDRWDLPGESHLLTTISTMGRPLAL